MANMKRIVILILCTSIVIALLVIAFRTVENSSYYQYRDLAITSCQSGDMHQAHVYVQTAIQHAQDQDLKSEGLHDQLLFDHNLCAE